MGGHVFISYSRSDREYVDRLAKHLRAEGIQVWYDKDLVIGRPFDEALQKQIESCAALLVVLTPASTESRWVGDELAYARDQGKPVLPVLLIDCSVPISLRRVHTEDVRGGRMPGLSFVNSLRADIEAAGEAARAPAPPTERQPHHVGIDLGATASCVSVYDHGSRRPVVVKDEHGHAERPTVARQPADGEAYVGRPALIHGILHPDSPAAEQPLSLVLGQLKLDVERRGEGRVTAATIATAPGMDNSLVAAAATQAGILVPQLLSSFAAAALAAHLERPRGQRALIVQIRDDHVSAGIAVLEPDRVEIVTAVTDQTLGVRRWDERLVHHLMGANVESLDATAALRVLTAADQVRRELSTEDSADVFLPLVAGNTHLFETVTRPVFDRLIEDLVRSVGDLVDRASRGEPIDRVVLIGEGALDPAIADVALARTGHQPEWLRLPQPIAMAAAWWAAVAAGQAHGPRLIEHTFSPK